MAQRIITFTGTNAQLDKGYDAIAWKHNYKDTKLQGENKSEFFERILKDIVNKAIKQKKKDDDKLANEIVVDQSPNELT